MRRALQLAAAVPRTSPNPRVGSVVVSGGAVVGRGAHRGSGHPHAETIALEDAAGAARGATLVVNLEPCNHHGRTPPCVEAIVAAGVARVVASIEDPDPRVSGSGFDALRRAGISVDVGVLASDAATLNEAYLHHRRAGRPLLRVKLALTIDGRLAAADGTSRWVTGAGARTRVHALRARSDAVMVGAGTIRADDPDLRIRDVPGDRSPAVVVVDGRGTVLPSARLFGADREVIVATTASSSHEVRTGWKEAGAEVVVLPGPDGRVALDELLFDLGRRGMLEVLCEGGAVLATSLIGAGLVDVLEVHRGPVLVGAAGPGVGALDVPTLSSAARWSLRSTRRDGDDVISIYSPPRGRS